MRKEKVLIVVVWIYVLRERTWLRGGGFVTAFEIGDPCALILFGLELNFLEIELSSELKSTTVFINGEYQVEDFYVRIGGLTEFVLEIVLILRFVENIVLN